MKKLRKTFKNIIDQHKKSIVDKNENDIKVMGRGHFGIVFDFGKAIFKITREGEYENIANSYNIINYLAEKGINCPQTYIVEQYDIDMKSSSFINLLFKASDRSEIYQDPEILYKQLETIENNNTNPTKDKLIGIVQEKIDGVTCFSPREMSKEEFLDFTLNLPEEQIYRFIMDANKIIQSGLFIDNCSKTNFIYNKDKGFYFIDLDGQDYGVRNPLQCTVGNFLDCICNNYCDEKLTEKEFSVFFKLFEITKKVYLGNINDKQLHSGSRSFIRNQIPEYAKHLFSHIDYLPSYKQTEYKQKLADVIVEVYGELDKQEFNTYYPQA